MAMTKSPRLFRKAKITATRSLPAPGNVLMRASPIRRQPTDKREFATRFFASGGQGDITNLVEFLATDAVFYGDGGGKAHAYPRPVVGRERVALIIKSLFTSARVSMFNSACADQRTTRRTVVQRQGPRDQCNCIRHCGTEVIQTIRSIVKP